jgi:hypothetical protein
VIAGPTVTNGRVHDYHRDHNPAIGMARTFGIQRNVERAQPNLSPR